VITLGWLIFTAGALIGWLARRALTDALMMAQEDTHKKQMDEIFEEVKRLRAQAANLIGAE
jgi:type VI protein secretion system component VasK